VIALIDPIHYMRTMREIRSGHVARMARNRHGVPFGGLGFALDAVLFRAVRLARSRWSRMAKAGKARVRPVAVPLWGKDLLIAFGRQPRAG